MYARMCMHACMHVFMRECVFACVFACVCVWTSIQYLNENASEYIDMFECICECLVVCVCACARELAWEKGSYLRVPTLHIYNADAYSVHGVVSIIHRIQIVMPCAPV